MNQENIKNWNQDKREEVASEIERIKANMEQSLDEFEKLIRKEWPSTYAHTEAYVIDHLRENLTNSNPHNSSMQEMIDELRGTQTDRYGNRIEGEPIDEFGESWDDDDDDTGLCYSCGDRGTVGAACRGCGGRGVYEAEGGS